MKSIFLGALCLIAQLNFAHAFSVEYTLKSHEKLKRVYKDAIVLEPEKLFDDDFKLRKFYKNVREGKCSRAIFDLGQAFYKKNPHLPDPKETRKRGLLAWNDIMMPRFYPELTFCRTMKSLNEVEQEIKAKKIPDRLPFSQVSRDYDIEDLPPLPLRKRSFDVHDLLRLAIFNYAPAQVALAKLSEKGEAVRLTPAYAYYLLARAKQSGYKASDLAPLLEKATAALSEQERERLAPRIVKGAWPNAERRVID